MLRLIHASGGEVLENAGDDDVGGVRRGLRRDQLLGVGLSFRVILAQFLGCPKTEQLVAARFGAEVQLLLVDETFFERFLSLIEGAHNSVLGYFMHLARRCRWLTAPPPGDIR